MKSKNITFSNRNGEKLSGRIELPLEDKPLAFAIFAHCFTCNKNYKAVRNISSELSREGVGVLIFDFTGLGESEGEFEETNFSSNVEDLISASEYIAENYPGKQFLVGHSLGGAAVLKAATLLQVVEGVVTIAAPYDPMHLKKLFKEQIEDIKEKGKARVDIGGRPFTLSKKFIEDLDQQEAEKVLKQLRKPLLILHSPQDRIVGIENAARIYEKAMHPKSFLSLDKADHLMSEEKDSQYAARMIASWMEAYLEKNETTDSETEDQLKAEEGFVRSITPHDRYTTTLKMGRHSLLADEPHDLGGDDKGPSPYNLLAAALASCTSMTLQMYAHRKEWPLEEVLVEVKHEKKHAEDCRECDEKKAKVDHFDRRISLEGELDEKKRERLLEIANKCPVHRSLEGDIQIESRLMPKKNGD